MLYWTELSDRCLATTKQILYSGIALTEDHCVLQSVDHPANHFLLSKHDLKQAIAT